MQLFNIFLFWIFFGFLTSLIAKKQGKNPLTWFFVGILLGIFGVILAYFLPKIEKKLKKESSNRITIAKAPIVLPPVPRELPEWFFLNSEKKALGPYNLEELSSYFYKQVLCEESYIWADGMEQWKKIRELPEIFQKIVEHKANQKS